MPPFCCVEKEKTNEGKGKKRAKKDPNAPKKPLSGYMLFLQDKRADIKAKYPGISVAEIAKKGGEMWNAQKDRTVSHTGVMFCVVLQRNCVFGYFICLCVSCLDAEVGGEGKEAEGAISERPR